MDERAQNFDRAIVIGGSMGGLLAARVRPYRPSKDSDPGVFLSVHRRALRGNIAS